MNEDKKACEFILPDGAALYVAPTEAEFKAMTPPQQRVAIARDVLANLATRRYEAAQRTYVEWELNRGSNEPLTVEKGYVIAGSHDTRGYTTVSYNMATMTVEGTVARDGVLPVCEERSLRRCAVCAVGSGVVSALCLNGSDMNELADNSHNGEWQELLGQWFSGRQVALLETAFEGTDEWYTYELFGDDEGDALYRRAIVFANDASSDERLRAIWQNVVDNEGEFVP